MRDRDLSVLEYPQVLALLAQFARSPGGKAACLRILPHTDPEAGRHARDVTAELFALTQEHGDLPLGEFPDIEQTLHQAARPGAILDEVSLLAVRAVLDSADAVLHFLRPRVGLFPKLALWPQRIDSMREVRQTLHRSLDPSGRVADEASEELAAVRREIRHLRERLQRRLEALLYDPRMQEYLGDRFVTVRHNRFVVPVRSALAARFDGVVQDRSASGETAFMEPLFAVEMNNRLALAIQEEERIVRRILLDLTEMVRDHIAGLESTFHALVELDTVAARVRMASCYGSTVPEWVDDAIELRQARHPLLLARDGEAVPVDLCIPVGKQALILTGPNTGGKTVALKTLGLLALMAQSGFLLPTAPGTRLPFFRAVWVDIGDEQSLERNLSTFSAHIANLVEIVGQSVRPALILLDEPGVGTDPEEGAALAIGLVRELLGPGVWLGVTTHYMPVKTFALGHDACLTAAVDFDIDSLRPRYRLIYHSVGESLALPIARRLGLPDSVLCKAEEARSEASRTLVDAIGSLESARRRFEERAAQAEAARAEAEAKRQEAERVQAQLAKLLDELRAKKREQWAAELREARQFLHDLKQRGKQLLAELESGGRSRGEFFQALQQEGEALDAVAHQGRAEADSNSELGESGSLQVGDWVEIPGEGIRGRLVSVAGERAWIQRGSLRFELPTKRLRRAAAEKRADARGRESPPVGAAATEISLLGLRASEAIEQLERFLDRATQGGERQVRIIHGVGSGTLRGAVREYLAHCPYRVRFRPGEPQEGGAGVTIVEWES